MSPSSTVLTTYSWSGKRRRGTITASSMPSFCCRRRAPAVHIQRCRLHRVHPRRSRPGWGSAARRPVPQHVPDVLVDRDLSGQSSVALSRARACSRSGEDAAIRLRTYIDRSVRRSGVPAVVHDERQQYAGGTRRQPWRLWRTCTEGAERSSIHATSVSGPCRSPGGCRRPTRSR